MYHSSRHSPVTKEIEASSVLFVDVHAGPSFITATALHCGYIGCGEDSRMSDYGKDSQGNLYRRVGGDSGGCGCLIGVVVVVLGVLGVIVTKLTPHAAWIGFHVYSFFNNNNSPGAYETKPDYFYACAGVLFVLAVGTVLATLVMILARSGRAAGIGGALFAMTIVAFIATVITYIEYFPHGGGNTQGYHAGGYTKVIQTDFRDPAVIHSGRIQ
jgi:hypothetical protein